MSKPVVYFKNLLDTEYQETVLQWRNQEFVRANMLDNCLISAESHRKYLEMLRSSSTSRTYVVFIKDEPCAVMTIKIKPEEKSILTGSYLVHEKYQGKGIGVITGYARLKYVFDMMPDGIMETIILEHNKKNLSLQRNFGCSLKSIEPVILSDGTVENAYLFTMTREEWEERKDRIEKLIGRLVPFDKIQWIEERKDDESGKV